MRQLLQKRRICFSLTRSRSRLTRAAFIALCLAPPRGCSTWFSQTYTDETSGITLDSLNIALGSPLSFSYNPSGGALPGVLVVGGVNDGAQMVQYNPSTNDFWLFISDFATAPAFTQVGYSQTALSSNNLFDTHAGSVSVSPFTAAAPEPATWAMMLAGFAGLGFLGYRQSATARIAG